MNLGIVILFTVVWLTYSCGRPTNISESERVKIISEINSTLVNYFGDVKKAGILSEFKYLDSSSTFFWVPPGYQPAIPYDSVAFILRQNANLYSSIDNSWDTIRIIPLSDEIATYTGRINSTMIDSGGRILKAMLIETGIVIKRKDGWKLFCGQTSILK